MLVLHCLLSVIFNFISAPVLFGVYLHFVAFYLLTSLRFYTFIIFAIRISFYGVIWIIFIEISLLILQDAYLIIIIYAIIADTGIFVLHLNLILYPLSDLFSDSDSFWGEQKLPPRYSARVLSFIQIYFPIWLTLLNLRDFAYYDGHRNVWLCSVCIFTLVLLVTLFGALPTISFTIRDPLLHLIWRCRM